MTEMIPVVCLEWRFRTKKQIDILLLFLLDKRVNFIYYLKMKAMKFLDNVHLLIFGDIYFYEME